MKASVFALRWTVWNGNDPILKERLSGRTINEGNHGEGCKELYYYPRQYADTFHIYETPLQVSAGSPSPMPTWWKPTGGAPKTNRNMNWKTRACLPMGKY